MATRFVRNHLDGTRLYAVICQIFDGVVFAPGLAHLDVLPRQHGVQQLFCSHAEGASCHRVRKFVVGALKGLFRV
jgi:hypothetical protein